MSKKCIIKKRENKNTQKSDFSDNKVDKNTFLMTLNRGVEKKVSRNMTPNFILPKFNNENLKIKKNNTISSFSSNKEQIKNVWMPEFNKDSKYIINISMCNNEVLKRVPTVSLSNPNYKRISTCSTIRPDKTKKIKDFIKVDEEKEDIENEEKEMKNLLNIKFYWNNESHEEVSNKVNNLSNNIKRNSESFGKNWIDFPKEIMGYVESKIYNKLLFIYENNQEYLLSNIKEIEIERKVTELEQWFIKIIKEKPKIKKQVQNWNNRQIKLLQNKRSLYFIEELLPYLGEINFNYTISQFIANPSLKKILHEKGFLE